MNTNLEDDLLLPGETKIWSLSLKKNGDKSKLETTLKNFLFIFETNAVLQILQNMMTLKNIFIKSTPRLFANKPPASARTATANVNLNQSIVMQ